MFAKTHLAELAGSSIKVPMLSMITILITTVYSYINFMSCVIHINIMSFLMSSKKVGAKEVADQQIATIPIQVGIL